MRHRTPAGTLKTPAATFTGAVYLDAVFIGFSNRAELLDVLPCVVDVAHMCATRALNQPEAEEVSGHAPTVWTSPPKGPDQPVNVAAEGIKTLPITSADHSRNKEHKVCD